MNESDQDYQLSLRALRGETHPQVDKARVRARLEARGILATAAASTVAVTATAQTGAGLSLATKLSGAVLASLTVFSLVYVARPVPRSKAPLEVTSSAETMRAVRAPQFTSYAKEAEGDAPVREAKRGVRRERSVLDLARENALLSAAMKALRAGDQAAAKSSLDQHEREFPSGFLRAEREKARARLGAMK